MCLNKSGDHSSDCGPLPDRIDLLVEVPALPVSALTEGSAGESSAGFRLGGGQSFVYSHDFSNSTFLRCQRQLGPCSVTAGVGSA